MTQRLETTTRRLTQSERVAAWRHVARRFAHELKNPLQPILISLYRIEQSLNESGHSEKLREALQAAAGEIKHLTALADRFSQLATLPPPRLELLDIGRTLKSLTELYSEQMASYVFEVRLPAQTVQAWADETYLRAALHNVLQNAMDASTPGGRIVLHLETDNDTVNILVRDFGKGMTPQEVAAAPMPYFTTKNKGSGLGLAIVEKVMTEMGGQMGIESEPGHGTTIRLSLSRNRQDPV